MAIEVKYQRKRSLAQTISIYTLRVLGWKLDANLPNAPKFLLVGAPHTSNWDFPLVLLILSALGIKPRWIGKDTIFRWPFGRLMKRLGGIPVNRRVRNNFVNKMVEIFQKHRELVVAISPEGTRSKTNHWKSGFYYIALGASVPIALGYIDYKRRMGGIGATIVPSGDIQADMIPIREFYSDKSGKHPHKQGEIVLGIRY